MTAAMIRRLEAERMGLSTAALHRRAERTADDAEKRELRTQLADARAALLAMTEDRDHLADALRRLCQTQIEEVTTARPQLRLVGRDGA